MIVRVTVKITKKTGYYSLHVAGYISPKQCADTADSLRKDYLYNDALFYVNLSHAGKMVFDDIYSEGNFDFATWRLPEQAQKRFVLNNLAYTDKGQAFYYCEY